MADRASTSTASAESVSGQSKADKAVANLVREFGFVVIAFRCPVGIIDGETTREFGAKVISWPLRYGRKATREEWEAQRAHFAARGMTHVPSYEQTIRDGYEMLIATP